ncbi:MAG: TfoX/Sxy family protein [Dehalococcoidia bacterium]
MDPFVETVVELLGVALGEARARPMFGGYGLYHRGMMVALVDDGRLYLKADAESQPAFRDAGSTPFLYERAGKPITLSYWEAPPGALDSADELYPWAELAREAARRAAFRQPGRTKNRPGNIQAGSNGRTV